MKQLARRASLVVVLLLTPVGTASAECAWVLWGVPYPPKDVMFLPVDAFKTREECMREKDSRSESIKAELKEGRSPGIVVSVCLPDTIDPRGPKGTQVETVSLLTELDAFFIDHHDWGDLDAGLDGPIVWIACPCGASMARRADVDDALASDG